MNRHLKALIIYTIVALIFTWPLFLHITNSYPSTYINEGGDPNMYLWYMDSAAQKLVNPNYHPGQMLFYPNGMNLMSGYEAPIILVVSTPVILISHNPILAYNILLLLGFILTAYSCYLLIYYFTKSNFASLFTGFSFGFSTYMMVRGVQHLDLLFLFTVPFIILSGFKFVENPSKKNTLLLVGLIVLTALSVWYYLVGGFIFLLLLGLFNLKKVKQNFKQYLYAAILTAIPLLIIAYPMIANRSNTFSHYVDLIVDLRGTELGNLLLPHPYMHSWTAGVYKTFPTLFEATSYIGIVGLIAIFVLALPKRFQIPHKKLWIVMMLVFLVISFGTHLQIVDYDIWMPIKFFGKFFPFNHLRSLNRFFIFSYTGATVVFGYFLAQLEPWLTKKRLGIGFLTILFLLLTSERIILPYPLVSIQVPEFYKTLGQDKENYAIADIPMEDPGRSVYDYFQLYHHKPIVDGEYFWTSFSPTTFKFIGSNPLLANSFTKSCSDYKEIEKANSQQVLEQLAQNNIRYIVVHNLYFLFDECFRLNSAIHTFFKDQKPVYIDGEITVYSTVDKNKQ